MCNKIYRRDVLLRDEHGNECFDIFPADMFFEDNAAGTSVYMKFSHYEMVPEGLYFYWMNPTSTVHTLDKAKMYDRIRSGYLMREYAQRYGYWEEYHDAAEIRLIEMMYVNTLDTMVANNMLDTELLRPLERAVQEIIPDWRKNPYLKEYLPLSNRILADMHSRGHLRLGIVLQSTVRTLTLQNPIVFKALRAIKFLFTDPQMFLVKLKKNLRRS